MEAAHSVFHVLVASMRRVLRVLAMRVNSSATCGTRRISGFFCKSVSTLVAEVSFMTRDPIQLYIPAAFL